MVAAWAGMGMYGGAVAGNGKVFLCYETACQGRQDGYMIEELLQAFLEVKRGILSVHEAFFDRFGDFGFHLLGFLFFLFQIVRLFAVVGSSFEREYKFDAGAVQSLSTQRESESLARPSEQRRKKRIKDLRICGCFLAGLPVLE